MGKRKRHRRNGLERNGRSRQVPRPATTGTRIRSAFKLVSSSWQPRLVAAAAVLLVAAGLWTDWDFVPARASLDALPDLDLSGAEIQVAEKIRRLHKEVERNSGSAAAWGKLAMNLDVHDLKREAIPCYKQAAELDPTDFRWPYYCATMLAETGSPEALEWFERSQTLNPNYAPVQVLYGQALIDHGRLKEASKTFQLALEANPKSSHAHLGLAQVALSQGDLEVSRQHLLQAVKIDARHGEVHGLLTEVYRRLNESVKAQRELRMAQQLPEITPVPDSVYAKLAAEGISAFWYETRGRVYLKRGRYTEAAREFAMALEVRPDAEAHHNIGFALHYLGKYEEAAEHYRTAIALKPAYRDALNNLATTLFELGNVAESIAYLEKAKRIDPAFPDAYLNLGIFLWRSGRTAEAIEEFRKGLTNAPYDPRTAMRLAWLLATSSQASFRNGAEAVRLAETVCELTDYRIPQTLDVLAAAYAETRQFSRAAEMARRAHQLALSARLQELADQIQSRLKWYQTNRPFRDTRF